MPLNFDAQINLDVGPFLANIEKAQAAVSALNQQISTLNSRKVTLNASVGGGVSSGDINSRKAAATAAVQGMKEEEAMARALGATEQNNAKVEWQAEMMRKRAMDARVKDHQTLSRSIDDQIAKEQKQRQAASNSIKTQMQETQKMNNLHTQALAMNQRFDAAKEAASNSAVRGLARERYALYDVAAAYQQVSRAAFTAVKAAAGTAIEYERAFADVERTTTFTSAKVGEAARVMKYSLTQVAAEIPVAFGKITEIATLGNQLGIAQGDIVAFTKTVSQFAATTGMSTDSVAMSFGRIGELLGEGDYNKLGSSIAYAGVKAVATEEQIASVTKEIATTAKMAKFTTPEVIGLATALSSVGIAPEAARGSIMRTFAGINEAVSKGGTELQNYANIAGMSADEFSKKWTTNGQIAFDSFVSGLQNMSDKGQNLDTVLRGIGLKNVRDIQTIQKLGDNYNVYAESIRNANKAYEEGTFLSESYATIQDTVQAKLDLIQNNFKNLLDSLGQGATSDMFKGLLDGVNAFLQTLNAAARNPFVRDFILPLVMGTTALVGAFAAVNAIVALSRAAMYAYASAMGFATVGANGLAVSLDKAAVAGKFFSTALNASVWMLGISIIIQGFSQIAAAMAPVEQRAESLMGGFAGLQDAVTSDTAAVIENARAAGMSAQAYADANGYIVVNSQSLSVNDQASQDAMTTHNNLQMIIGNEPNLLNASSTALNDNTMYIGANTVAWLKNAMVQSKAFQEMAKDKDLMAALTAGGYDFNKAMKAVANGNADAYFGQFKKALQGKGGFFGSEFAALFGAYKYPIDKLNDLKDAFVGTYNEAILLGLNGEQVAQKLATKFNVPVKKVKELTKALKETKQEVRTVVDYANDLVSVFKRIDDIKFGKQIALDDITSGWADMAQAAEDAEKAVRDAQATIDSLTADKGILEYQLQVAIRYGDTVREAAIRAKLAKLNNELADAEKAKADATDAASNSTQGNSKSAIANRAALIGMLSKYQEYIKALAATGVKGADLEKAVADLKAEFIQQGLQLGYNTTDLETYANTFDDYATAVKEVPRDVTIEFDANKSAAFNAIQEYLAKNHKLNVDVVVNGSVPSVGGGTGGGGGVAPTPAVPAWVTQAKADIAKYTKQANAVAATIAVYNKQIAAIKSGGGTADAKAKAIATIQSKIQGELYKRTMLGQSIVILQTKLADAGYAEGGFVSGSGSGSSDSIPARLSNGEFVVKAAAVKTYGVDFLNSLNQMKFGKFAPAVMPNNGGGAESKVVYLSPEDRALLRNAIDRPIALYTENTTIAKSANAGNVILAQRGSK